MGFSIPPSLARRGSRLAFALALLALAGCATSPVLRALHPDDDDSPVRFLPLFEEGPAKPPPPPASGNTVNLTLPDSTAPAGKAGQAGQAGREAAKAATAEADKAKEKGKPKEGKPAEDVEPNKTAEDEKETEEKKKHREPWLSVHGQGTIISQVHDNFPALYTGPNSLIPDEPSATTETATLYLDARLWRGSEIVFDPEISGGKGFSGTHGLAGFSNGEATRVGVLEPTPYIARLFWRGTWDLDGEWERAEDAPNQLPGHRDKDRFVVSVGKMSATDYIDDNRYSHDPRTQFLNWSLMFNGAWDYPANVRGYTYGVVLDLETMFYALRYGIFAEPFEANGAAFDPHFLKANGEILELEERYLLVDCPGKVREWVYLNHARMGNYQEALELMPVDPDITETRAYRFKYGFGVNVEQEVTKELGVFLRAGWNDGHSESWAFTEIDHTCAFGMLLKGKWWKRPNDQVGIAGVINGISPDHRHYLAAGGLGFIIGDGALNYSPEEILEMYYNCELHKGIYATLDFQEVNHPAYNEDRGPVSIFSLRVHFEY